MLLHSKVILCFVVFLLCADHAASADPPKETPPSYSKACDEEGRQGWMMRQTILGITNPLGAVVETQFGYCRPLVKKPGILWFLTQWEAGAFHFITPSFTRQGAYFKLIPLSFLVLDFRIAGVYYWPLPGFRAAAYFGATGPDMTWPSDGITNEVTVNKEHGGGVNATARLVLRGSVTLKKLAKGPLELLALNAFSMDYWYFPGYDYYYNQRADAVLARSDVVLGNTAALLLGIPLSHKVAFQFGITDSLNYMPLRAQMAWNQVGAIFLMPIKTQNRHIAELVPFLRVSAYTEHFTRDLSFAWNFLLGVDLAIRL